MEAASNAYHGSKTHISLNVRDIDRSVAFYEAFFGTSAHKRRPGYANFDIANPPLKLALQQHEPQGQGALNHLGILVAEAESVHETKARLEASGLITFSETDTTCCYARQDKVWVRDPDGNSWEVYVLLDDMLDADDHLDHADQLRGAPGHQSGTCCAPQPTPDEATPQARACCPDTCCTDPAAPASVTVSVGAGRR